MKCIHCKKEFPLKLVTYREQFKEYILDKEQVKKVFLEYYNEDLFNEYAEDFEKVKDKLDQVCEDYLEYNIPVDYVCCNEKYVLYLSTDQKELYFTK